jgi:hypothetical protein
VGVGVGGRHFGLGVSGDSGGWWDGGGEIWGEKKSVFSYQLSPIKLRVGVGHMKVLYCTLI